MTVIGIAGTSLFFVFNTAPKQALALSGDNSGRCLSFNGSSSNVDFGSANFGLSASNTMTIGAWIKWGNKTGIASWANIATLNSAVSNGDVGQFWLQHDATNNYFEFAVQTTVSRKFVGATTPCITGNWYYVTGVYDGANIKMYVNGNLQASVTQTGNIAPFTTDYKFMIGKWAYTGRWFNGDIDEVCLWNTALSQTQIRSMMCKKLNGNESGLAGYWRMNEASGSVVADKTSGGHNGTINAAARNYSSAPVGDTAVYAFGSGQLTFVNFRGDSLKVNNFSSTPAGIVIYRIDTVPNSTSAASEFTAIGHAYYYGIFFPDYNNETYNVTYYFNGYPGIVDKTQLALAYRTSNNDMSWLNLSATLNTSTNLLSKSALSGRHEFVLATKSPANTLPVEMVSFNAGVDERSVDLRWQTASEINNDHFTIERSTDGQHFENIMEIAGAGNSTTLRSYAATDEHPPAGHVYYKLRQTDYDGHYKEFNIESVIFESSDESFIRIENVYPNPFKDHIRIIFNADHVQPINISIFDMGGKLIFSKESVTETGINKMEIFPDGNIPDGMYSLVVSDKGKHEEKFRLVKTGALAFN